MTDMLYAMEQIADGQHALGQIQVRLAKLSESAKALGLDALSADLEKLRVSVFDASHSVSVGARIFSQADGLQKATHEVPK
jgi:hypothetical protein